MLEDALEHLVKGIVDHPEDVTVDLLTNRRGKTLEIRVHPDDLGKVIGRGGGHRHGRAPGGGVRGGGARGAAGRCGGAGRAEPGGRRPNPPKQTPPRPRWWSAAS